MGQNESKLQDLDEQRWVKEHPGPITNADLLEDDKQQYNLYGTNTVEKFEAEYLDTYVDPNMN